MLVLRPPRLSILHSLSTRLLTKTCQPTVLRLPSPVELARLEVGLHQVHQARRRGVAHHAEVHLHRRSEDRGTREAIIFCKVIT